MIESLKIPIKTSQIDSGVLLTTMALVGLPDTSVKESKDRVSTALANSGYTFPMGKTIIPATKAAVLKSLKNGDLTPTKRPLGYGKMTHAELCRWVGVTPHLFRNRKKVPSQ